MTLQSINMTTPLIDPDGAGNRYIVDEPIWRDATGAVHYFQGNTDLTIASSAARTTTFSSSTIINDSWRGIFIFLRVSAASGTGGLTVKLLPIDPVSGQGGSQFSATTAVSATGIYTYVIYPGIGSVDVQSQNAPLPRQFQIWVSAGDSSSYTYSVGASLLN